MTEDGPCLGKTDADEALSSMVAATGGFKDLLADYSLRRRARARAQGTFLVSAPLHRAQSGIGFFDSLKFIINSRVEEKSTKFPENTWLVAALREA